MSDLAALITKLEDKAGQVEGLEKVFSRISVSRALSPDAAKKVATSIAILMDKIKTFEDGRPKGSSLKKEYDSAVAARQDAVAAKDLEEAKRLEIVIEGLAKDAGGEFVNTLKAYKDFFFLQEYDFVVGIIADILGITDTEARSIPVSCIYDFVIKDKIVCSFFPQLRLWGAG